MTDQASTLRFIASNSPSLTIAAPSIQTGHRPLAESSSKPRYVAVTGGKGGVGKSNLSVNLALALGAIDKRVALLDADFGLANADILCGIAPKFHLGHVIKGLKDIDDIKIKIADNVNLIPSGSGFEDLANLSFNIHSYLFAKLRAEAEKVDFLLIDTAAGIAENVAGVLIASEEIIVVVTPEPTSIVDAYATIKMILRHAPGKKISLVVNTVVGVGDGEKVFRQIQSAVKGFLSHEIEFLGMIPQDSNVSEAVRAQVPVIQYAPDAPSSRAISLIAKQLHQGKQKPSNFSAPEISFWEMLARG